MARKVSVDELLQMAASGAKITRKEATPEFADALRELTAKLGELLARNPNVVVESQPLDLKVDAPPVHIDYAPPAINLPAPTVVVRGRFNFEFVVHRNDRGQIARVEANVVDGE